MLDWTLLGSRIYKGRRRRRRRGRKHTKRLVKP